MRKIGHIHLKVSDLAQAERFYSAILALEVTERVGGRFVFLSFGAAHHDVALQAHPDAPRADPRALGLYHVAFELGDEAELGRAARRLEEHRVPYVAIDHGISKALYFADPDGHGIELYVDTRERRDRWDGFSEPLDVRSLG